MLTGDFSRVHRRQKASQKAQGIIDYFCTINNMERDAQHSVPKIISAIGIVLLFALGFMLLGMFIDIQVISEYNYTPISFTFTLLFCGVPLDIFLALRTIIDRKLE